MEGRRYPRSPTASGFGADGLALDGAGHLYVTNFSAATLLRISIESDGSAGAIAPIAITPAPGAPDGMRWLGADTLVWADGAGSLAVVALSGATAAVTTVATGLNGPTSVVRVGSTYWVSEGQIAHLLDGTPPTTPLTVRAIPANHHRQRSYGNRRPQRRAGAARRAALVRGLGARSRAAFTAP